MLGTRGPQKNAERDYLHSALRTLSNSYNVALPPLIRINIVRNSIIGTTIIWTSDGTALYAMAVGNSFENAVDKLARIIREKPPHTPFIIPGGVEKCFRENPKLCA